MKYNTILHTSLHLGSFFKLFCLEHRCASNIFNDLHLINRREMRNSSKENFSSAYKNVPKPLYVPRLNLSFDNIAFSFMLCFRDLKKTIMAYRSSTGSIFLKHQWCNTKILVISAFVLDFCLEGSTDYFLALAPTKKSELILIITSSLKTNHNNSFYWNFSV